MSKFRQGDQVVSVRDIGGVLRDSVPKGTPGVVTDSGGWGGQATVRFTIPGGLFTGRRVVDIRVGDDEIQ